MTGPDFTDLFDDDLPQEEAARLRHVHEMLVEAGPPPELPPSLAAGPGRKKENVSLMPRRRVGATLLIAAAIALVVFGGGYLLGHHRASFTAETAIPMHGANGTTATASLELASETAAGNSPIQMVIRGLPNLGKKGYYELLLTRGSRRLASCGTFVVGKNTTTVRLNAPYLLPEGQKAGWIVIAHVRGETGTPPALLTT